jgi:death-on-curing family protein
MGRAKLTVRQLAAEAAISTDDTLLRLWERGIHASSPSDFVSKNKIKEARRALGLPVEKTKLTVQDLSERYGLPEQQIREILDRKRIKPQGDRFIPNVLAKLAEATVREHLSVAKRATVSVQATVKPEKTKEDRRRKIEERRSHWPIIGRAEEDISFLSAEDVNQIHWSLVRDFSKSRDPIDPPGLRSTDLLESAVFRPHTAIGESSKYPSIAMSGAALFHALVHDHCFHNGNKRTALVALLVFLDKNGYVLIVEEEDLFNYVLSVSRHSLLDEAPGPGKDYADRESSVSYAKS